MRRAALAIALLSVTALLAGCASTQPGTPASEHGSAVAPSGVAAQAAGAVPAGKYDFKGPFSRVLEPGALKIKPVEHVYVPSSDGVDIELGVWRPDTTEPVPVLVHASPYYGFTFGIGSTVTDDSGYYGNLIDNFVPHGYAVVGLAVRGTGDSGGCNDLMGPKERADIDTALTWLGTQSWSSGSIAMTGLSYDGSTPWTGASTGNPHLKTIIPLDGVPDLYGLMYRNGSSEDRGPILLNGLYYSEDMATYGASPQHTAQKAACPEALEGLAYSAYSGATGANDPMGFWDARNRKPLVEQNYHGSVFSVQGLDDWNVDPSQVIPWVDHLESLGLHTKQLFGQWVHTYPDSIDAGGVNAKDFRADYNEILLRWLDHELKGLPVDTGPAVEVRDANGQWRVEDHFPPHDATWTTYNLTSAGLLDTKSNGPRTSAVLYPQAAAGIPPNPPASVDLGVKGAAKFTLGPLPQDLRISGLPKVHITVTPSGPGGYIGAYLYDLDPKAGDNCQDGKRIGWTTMNLAFADGGRDQHQVQPGQPLQAMLEIQPMDAKVAQGHLLSLCVWVYTEGSGTDIRLPTLPPAPVTLEMGGDVKSVLVLPTVARDPSTSFDVPTP
jgi:X-Pro dipeptidyl-peptidase